MSVLTGNIEGSFPLGNSVISARERIDCVGVFKENQRKEQEVQKPIAEFEALAMAADTCVIQFGKLNYFTKVLDEGMALSNTYTYGRKDQRGLCYRGVLDGDGEWWWWTRSVFAPTVETGIFKN